MLWQQVVCSFIIPYLKARVIIIYFFYSHFGVPTARQHGCLQYHIPTGMLIATTLLIGFVTTLPGSGNTLFIEISSVGKFCV